MGMSDRNHDRPALLVQAERNREQPAHGGVQPVKGAEPRKCQP